MNLQQPGEASPPPPLSSTAADIDGDGTSNNRRRTRTRSSGSYNDNFENSSDEEEEFVDHVSALLMSRQQQQQQQQQQHNSVDQSPMEEPYDDSHDINATKGAGELVVTSSSDTSLQRQHSHGDPPIVAYDTSFEEDDDDEDNYHDTSNNNSNNNDAELLTAQQNRLRELMAQSDDCWGADLSDDELDLNLGNGGSNNRNNIIGYTANFERGRKKEMTVNYEQSSSVASVAACDHSKASSTTVNNNSDGRDRDDKNNSTAIGYTSSPTPKRKNSHSSNSNNINSSINIQNINYRHQLQPSSPSSRQLLQSKPQQQPQQMSLQNPRQQQQFNAKEQLLQQRIRHQQRLHRKHSNEQKVPSSSSSSSDRIRQLTAKSSQKSGLFPEEDNDDDNSSIVVSNGSAAVVTAMKFASSSSSGNSKKSGKVQSLSSSSPPLRSQQQRQHPPQPPMSSSLNSLPSRPTCQTFPDEADRKRIVGCLAAILASSYTHETAPHLLVKKESSKQQQSHQQSQQQQFYEEHQQLQQRDVPLNDSSLLTSNEVGANTRRPSFDVSLSSSSLEGKDDGTFTPTKKKPQHQQNVGNNHPLSIDSTTSINHHHHVLQPHKQQQQLIRQSSATYSSNNTGNTATSPTQHGSSTSITTTTTKAPSFHQSFTSSINNSIQKASLSTTSSTQPPSKLKDELAEIRHRIRRHVIYSELLVSSADLLLLDSSHAKAFLPMLEGLLTKVEVDDTSSVHGGGGGSNYVGNDSIMGAGSSHGGQQQRQSWKGRGFGGGGVVVDSDLLMQQQTASMKQGADNAPPPPPAKPLSNNRVRSNSVPRHDQPSMKSKTKKNAEMSEKKVASAPNSGDLYAPFHAVETSAARSRAASSPSLPPSTPPTYAPLETVMVDKDLIAPFLQTLTPGAGFSCIALLLLNHLLRDGRGYDARVRQAFKRLAVVVLSHELKVGGILRVDLEEEDDLDSMLRSTTQQPNSNEDGVLDDADELARLAARKFEAMEHAIAAKLIAMSGETSAEAETETAANRGRGSRQQSSATRSHSQSAPASVNTTPNSSSHGGRIALAPKETPTSSQHGISREQLLRGIKVGTAGAVGATLFALTGGLAAPGIAAGLAAVAGGSALAAGVTTVLSSAAAITTIFGVGGAGLAGYKMHRRTKGLTEFDFQKEQLGKNSEAELFSTVCISGWLRDARDFQRPWGVSPSHPRIIDKQELLERFYFIHNPDNVHRVPEILKHWKGRYFQLWRALKEKYGSDPSNLFPLRNGPRISAELTHEEGLSVDFLMDELGYTPKKKPPPKEKKSHFFGMKSSSAATTERQVSSTATRPKSSPPKDPKELQSAQRQLTDSTLKKKKGLLETIGVNSSELASSLSLFSESETNSINDNSTHTASSIPDTSNRGTSQRQTTNNDAAAVKPPPKHLLTVWDYHANYGGELYTVRWESDLLMELCDSVADQMIEWGVSATKTILHTTVFATLMTAVTLPYSLVLAANAIDSSWTMATERADRAGVELAKNLIDSNAGHRPVVLVGFSMGARVIYSCLKELARHQEIWEDHQQKKKLPPSKRKQKENNQGEEQLKYIREPASIVEDAILMGTPNHISLKSWEACRRVVAGRLVNCYSRKDLILSLMFQMKKFQGILRAICGTSPVTVNGVENFDVTDLVTGHTDYCLVSGEILKRVRHGQPQRASVSGNEVMAMVTTIKVANNDFSLASLADEAERSSK